ncbi:MAG TPA: hypothetical protein VK171_11940 [Fimbriimonas sp.]|nr:hypothetical protein [Fimbriimonas sp.]
MVSNYPRSIGGYRLTASTHAALREFQVEVSQLWNVTVVCALNAILFFKYVDMLALFCLILVLSMVIAQPNILRSLKALAVVIPEPAELQHKLTQIRWAIRMCAVPGLGLLICSVLCLATRRELARGERMTLVEVHPEPPS